MRAAGRCAKVGIVGNEIDPRGCAVSTSLMVVTRLRLSADVHRADFLRSAFEVGEQVEAAAGCQGSDVFPDADDVFWTWTRWDDVDSMRAFMRSDPHRSAMRHIRDWCDEATYVEWEHDGPCPLDWTVAHARLVTEGVPTRLANPSPAHGEKRFPPPRVQ